MKKYFIPLVLALAVINSCSLLPRNEDPAYNAAILNQLDALDDANESSPPAPEIVAGKNIGSRAISKALVDASNQDFTDDFLQIQGASSNYDGMISMALETVNQIDTDSLTATSTSIGPYTKLWETGGKKFYENDDASITSYLSPGAVETRQFEAFSVAENAEYEYSRSYFCWPTGSGGMEPGIDITEVWEYDDYKLVSVTMFYPTSGDNGNYSKWLAVTDTTDEYQRTVMAYGSFSSLFSGYFCYADYESLGYIDFSMTEAVVTSFPGAEDFFPDNYPSLADLEGLHYRSLRMTNAKTAFESLAEDYTVPFSGFVSN